jgi:hypothetical protein
MGILRFFEDSKAPATDSTGATPAGITMAVMFVMLFGRIKNTAVS